MPHISISDLENNYKDKILNNPIIGSIVPFESNYSISLQFCPFDFIQWKFFYEYFNNFNVNGYKRSFRTLKQHILTVQEVPYYRQLMLVHLSDEQYNLLKS
jgi:hypothetical protein